MLLVKCDQCGASYKLSEELFRRKAEGFGVVVTCRRCRKEILVDERKAQKALDEPAESDAVPTAPANAKPEESTKVETAGAADVRAQAPSPPVPKVAPKARISMPFQVNMYVPTLIFKMNFLFVCPYCS
jgi:hypothetical protein